MRQISDTGEGEKMRIEDLAAYEIISRQKIHDLRSEGYLLRHKKSGARIALLSNEDENKVFYIGFKTPPADSTGCLLYTSPSPRDS